MPRGAGGGSGKQANGADQAGTAHASVAERGRLARGRPAAPPAGAHGSGTATANGTAAQADTGSRRSVRAQAARTRFSKRRQRLMKPSR